MHWNDCMFVYFLSWEEYYFGFFSAHLLTYPADQLSLYAIIKAWGKWLFGFHTMTPSKMWSMAFQWLFLNINPITWVHRLIEFWVMGSAAASPSPLLVIYISAKYEWWDRGWWYFADYWFREWIHKKRADRRSATGHVCGLAQYSPCKFLVTLIRACVVTDGVSEGAFSLRRLGPNAVRVWFHTGPWIPGHFSLQTDPGLQ